MPTNSLCALRERAGTLHGSSRQECNIERRDKK
jgi:hypothetical protein